MKINLAVDVDKQTLKEQYQQAIADLQTIQNTSNPTNAQVIWAVKKEAEILEKMLKVLKRMVT